VVISMSYSSDLRCQGFELGNLIVASCYIHLKSGSGVIIASLNAKQSRIYIMYVNLESSSQSYTAEAQVSRINLFNLGKGSFLRQYKRRNFAKLRFDIDNLLGGAGGGGSGDLTISNSRYLALGILL
jgi:hypothetical protein